MLPEQAIREYRYLREMPANQFLDKVDDLLYRLMGETEARYVNFFDWFDRMMILEDNFFDELADQGLIQVASGLTDNDETIRVSSLIPPGHGGDCRLAG